MIADSKGDIQRGLEVIEFACGIPHALKGEYTEGAGPGIDVYSMRQPLGRCRRHHPVQLSRHDPDVDVRRRHRLRQYFCAEAEREGPERARTPGRADDGSGRAGWRAQCCTWRQGSGGRDHRPSRDQGDQLRRLLRHRPLHLFARNRQRQTRAGDGRGQEPWRGAARCGFGSSGEGPRRRSVRQRGRTLHGVAGGGAGGQENRRRLARAALAGNRAHEGRHFHRSRRAIRPGGERRAQGED